MKENSVLIRDWDPDLQHPSPSPLPPLPPVQPRVLTFYIECKQRKAAKLTYSGIATYIAFALYFLLQYLPKKVPLKAQGVESLWTTSLGIWPCSIARIFSQISGPTCIYSEDWNEVKELYDISISAKKNRLIASKQKLASYLPITAAIWAQISAQTGQSSPGASSLSHGN